MAGNVKPRKMAMDLGSVSGKAVSEFSQPGQESFLSIAAPTTLQALDGFDKSFKMKSDNSFRLEILGINSEGRFDYQNRKAWIIGGDAVYESNMIYMERDMRRFQSEQYIPFVCASLRVAFPKTTHTLEELKSNNWIVKNSWATPVHIFASIAPGYFSSSNLIIEALRDRYLAFVDMETKELYVFRIENVDVVPESFGSFQYILFEPPVPDKELKRRKKAEMIERVTTTIIDFGGQTLDYMSWRERRIIPNQYGTQLVGFNNFVDNIAKDVFNEPSNNGLFAIQPTRANVFQAMRGNFGKAMTVRAAAGKPIDITEHVRAQMNNFASMITGVWRDRLYSGQTSDIVYLTGGAAIDAYPYFKNRLEHEKLFFVSKNKNHQEMWMANAMGTMMWAIYNGK